jgi:hypothetical protein
MAISLLIYQRVKNPNMNPPQRGIKNLNIPMTKNKIPQVGKGIS